jgi:hypothetical protein
MKKLVCLESDWEDWDKPKSVLPMLQLLSYRENGRLTYVHKYCNSKKDFLDNATEVGKHKRFEIVYVAMHGSRGEIHPGKESIYLQDLSEHTGRKWENRIVHFGSCAVLYSEEKVKNFQKETGIALITGFRKNIDWDYSTAFDYLCLTHLLNDNNDGHLINRLHKLAKGPFADLGFVSCRKGNYRRSN